MSREGLGQIRPCLPLEGRRKTRRPIRTTNTRPIRTTNTRPIRTTNTRPIRTTNTRSIFLNGGIIWD